MSGGRGAVVVPHGYRSVPFLELAAAAASVCDLLWLVDPADPVAAHDAPILARLGRVIELTADPVDVAARVGAERPGGVVAFRDEDLCPMAELAERLGLAFHTPVVAERLADKALQRRALAAGGLPTPGVWELDASRGPGEIAALAGRLPYPVVLKPRRGSGSRHTLVCHDASELTGWLGWLETAPGGPEPMVLEEYLPSCPGAAEDRFADYVSVETLAAGGRYSHFAVTGRLHPVPSLRETGFFVPAALGEAALGEVLATATDALGALGVAEGATHTEVKLTPAGPRVIEVNGRLGGGVGELVAQGSGAEVLAGCLRAALGRPAGLELPLAWDRIGFRLFLQPPLSARRVLAIEGLEAVRALPGVRSVGVHLGPGDALDPRQGTRAFVLAVAGRASSHDEVVEIDRQLHQVAGVRYEHDPGDPAALGGLGEAAVA